MNVQFDKFSVLISVYEKETTQNLREALDSVFINQEVLPSEVVLVKDGKLTKELDFLINEYKKKFGNKFKIVTLEKNVGLGEALNIGIGYCSFELIARMDSDDISCSHRFKLQLEEFKKEKGLDLVGGHIAEFFLDLNKIETIRKVPLTFKDIKNRLKIRNPINHVTVMFKKSSVIKAGGYKPLLFLEDYYLWMRMIAKEMNIKNIDEILVLVRTGDNMFKRRSNRESINSWIYLQKKMLKESIITKWEFLRNVFNIIIFVNTPPNLKKHIYKFFLREKK